MANLWRGIDPRQNVGYLQNNALRTAQMIKIIDAGGFRWRLLAVGASGFFATSYGFITNSVIKPALYYLYPPCGRLDNAGMVLDELTLVAMVIGMLAAGHLADRWGRKKLYGFELTILIIATLGVVQASEGFRSQYADGSYEYTMDIYSWIAWWRMLLGLGIGAEYPIVSIITAEWSATKSRGRMLASVFAVQPFARLLAYGVLLAALRVSSAKNGLSPDAMEDDAAFTAKRVADQVWRWVAGLALVPAVLAIGLRVTIPESPRYYADIVRDMAQALARAARYSSVSDAVEESGNKVGDDALPAAGTAEPKDNSNNNRPKETVGWFAGAWHYLNQSGPHQCGPHTPGRRLAALSTIWFLTDTCWYILSLDSGSGMSTQWRLDSPVINSTLASIPGQSCPELNSWRSDPSHPKSIYHEFEGQSVSFMLIDSIGSVLGNLALICLINRIHRRHLLIATLLGLGLLFTIAGAIVIATGTGVTEVKVLFGVMQFLFSLGPRTLVMILGAEMFPTVYRGTFYGVAAAVGKIGAIVIRPIIGRTGKGQVALGARLLVAVPLTLVAAWLAAKQLPLVQKPREREGETGGEEGPTYAAQESDEGERERADGGVVIDAAATAEGEDLNRRERTQTVLGVLGQKLEDMKLEEIAPNPGLDVI
ncbi:major facilitator superfamily domain-containing protein [Podospora didyma]|uniref:Major facilitator superfamily domain-containing protein n=1 Tax=Podospora didyma TaxID=330526 RepID=A0AAE0NSR9_9PEZI|nr:major facilitator superfamily domain-containing protein [Podospora didyma]